tara:strand:+ start:7174 stop:7560 length:387 start_codon:yes stop_codon:yes gene_type:complete
MNSELNIDNLENVVNNNIISDEKDDIENDNIKKAIDNTINNKKPSINWSKIEKDKNIKKENKLKVMSYFILIFTLLWFVTGLLGWLMSIYCFNYSKSKIENVVGVLIATFLGPFYWLYYIYMQNYCGR